MTSSRAISLDIVPGTRTPEVNINTFGFVTQSFNGNSKQFAYYSREHDLITICTPGYFNSARTFGLRKWDCIDVCYGDDPRTAKEVRLRVIECDLSHEGIVKVAKGRIQQFQAVEHGVEPEADEAA